jgi:hypothetical protein
MSLQVFWVLYDYGQGGLWAVVRAESVAQISTLYPSLRVFESPPQSLDRATKERILRAGVQDLEHPRLDWLGDLLRSNPGARPHGAMSSG